MSKKLVKIAAGIGTAASVFYWGVLPVLAAGFCPEKGIKPPGCEGGVDAMKIIGSAVNVLLFAAFVIALIFLVIGGIRWIVSGGDKEGTTKARETVTSALIGLAVVLAAWVLINIILKYFTGSDLTNIQFPTLEVK